MNPSSPVPTDPLRPPERCCRPVVLLRPPRWKPQPLQGHWDVAASRSDTYCQNAFLTCWRLGYVFR